MKRTIIFSIINVFLAFSIMAQDEAVAPTNISLASKKGFAILPAAGDFALGTDALPFLRYAGNFLNGATATNSLNLNTMNIYGRYFLSYNTSVRINLYADNGTDIVKHFVQDDAAVLADPLSRKKNEDKRINTYSSWSISAGLQQYRGYGRLQGFYGATLGFGSDRSTFKYEYGNAITLANQSPTTVTSWGNGANSAQAQREIERDYGLGYSITLSPVAGVEFYFAPKMCIGAEANIFYRHSWRTEADFKEETWVDGGVQEIITEDTPGNISRNFSTSGLGAYGGLYVMFHF